MKTAAKVVAAVIAFLVFVVVAAAIVLPLVFNPNDFKPQIKRAVHKKTGRELKIPGDISLSVFPRLSLDIGRASLSNPAGFGNQPFARIKNAKVRVELLPLLHKRMHVDTVSLEGMNLHLIKDAKGHTNWSGLTGKGGAGQHKKPQPQQGRPVLSSLRIGSISVKNSAITYYNAKNNTRDKIENVHLEAGPLKNAAPSPLNLGFKLTTSKPRMTVKVHSTGKVTANIGESRYKISHLAVTAQAEGKGVPGGSRTLSLNADAAADLKAQTARISDLKLEVAGITAKANVQAQQITDKPRFSGKLNVAPFNPRTVMDRLDMKAPATKDPKALAQASLSSDFTGTPESVSLKGLQAKLDDSKLTGQATVNGFTRPHVRFEMALDHMDVNRYLPRSGQSKKDPKPGGGKDSPDVQFDINTVEIPVDMIKRVNAEGTLTAGSLSLMRLHFNQTRLTVKAKNGRLIIQPLSSQAYQGAIKLTSTVDASAKRPTYAVSARLLGVHFSPLLRDLLGKHLLGGTGALTLDLTSAGKTLGDIRRGLNGKLHLHLANGTLYGFSLSNLIAAARARLQDKSAPGNKNKTEFKAFDFRATVDDGTVHSHHLTVHSPWFNLSGSGSANLVTNKLDYVAQARLTKQPPGQSGHTLAALEGVEIPVHFQGGIMSPQISVDVATALRRAFFGKTQQRREGAKNRGRKGVQQQEKNLQNKARETLQQLLGQ